jgi:hypothetical protein
MLLALRLFLVTGIMLMTIPAIAAADQLPQLPASSPAISASDQNLSVTCYLGNPNDGNSLGSIMVNGAAAAGPSCNSLNFSCQGRCYGCYSDFDLSEDVCVDSSGRKFLR